MTQNFSLRRAVAAAMSTLLSWPGMRHIAHGLLQIAARFPDGRWKVRLVNHTEMLPWGDFVFSARAVQLGSAQMWLRPHAAEFDYAASVYQTLPYEPEVYAHLDRQAPYDTVFDIGANVGVFTLYIAHHFPQAKIFSFEPGREAFRRFLDNLALNPEISDRVSPFFAAVGGDGPVMTIHAPVGHLTNSSIDPNFAGIFGQTQAFLVQSVDATLFRRLWPETGRSLLKVDAEGAEPAILQALMPLILARRPDILLEILDSQRVCLADILQQLHAAGYVLSRIQDGGTLHDFESSTEEDGRDCWLQIPPESS